jgi:hypothetical protein
MTTAVDFEAINAAALWAGRTLLQQLVPGGKFLSLEYVVRNPRRNDQNPSSFDQAVNSLGHSGDLVPPDGGVAC